MSIQLRPYQQEAREAVHREWETRRSTLLVIPTGGGKTIIFSAIIEDCVRKGQRVLVLAHRGELLEQAADKLHKSTGLQCAVEQAEQSCLEGRTQVRRATGNADIAGAKPAADPWSDAGRPSWFRVVVGSVQTLQREKRLQQFAPDYFDVIIIDEAHHALADGYRVILDYFSGAKILGVTATPDRGDMKDLGAVFESLAYEYTLPRAVNEGYLAPIKAVTIPLKLDISQVGVQSGDYKPGELGTALDPYLDQIAEVIARECADRKTVVFLPLIATAKKMRDILNRHGMRAAEVNGQSGDRAEILADFEADRYNVLCNAMLLTEGWDCPSVDCIVVLRPTKQRGLYCQMVGRGTRLYPGSEVGATAPTSPSDCSQSPDEAHGGVHRRRGPKDHLLLLDFLWHTERHQLCRPAHLVAKTDDVANKMVKTMEDTAGSAPIDLMAAESKAAQDVVADREASLAKQLHEMRTRKRRLVDPLQFELSIQAEDLSGYVPTFGWESDPPTEQQLGRLEKLGIFPDDIDSAGKAAKLLERLDARIQSGLSTPKQIRFLEGKGFQHVGTWSFEAARKMIDRIAAGGWRVPYGVNPASYVPAAKQEVMAL